MKSTTVQQWTKEIPTEGGWYWVKYKGNKFVWYIDESGSVYNEYWKGGLWWIEDIEFFGPLEEPK